MTSFAHAHYPTQHPGVIRAEQAIKALGTLATALGAQVRRHVQAWRLARQDARIWELAQHDPRLLAELRLARD